MKVLIADDHAASRKLLRLTLAAGGHEVIEASDGQEALDKLESSQVDAVISDILMPRMDGYRFCYETRRKTGLQNVPIIIYSSTYTSPTEESVALNMGADRFLRKPSPAAVILQTLSDVTSRPRSPRVYAPDGELQVLKEYSERLVQKLEEKNVELEAAQEKLSAAYDKLERSERRFRELVELAPIGIIQTAPDGLFIAANTAFARMLGYSFPKELMGLELAEDVYADPADRARLLDELNRREKTSGLEVKLKKRDGAPIWVRADGRAVKDPTGRVLRYEVFVLDVTERKRAEGEMRRSEERFRRLFESNTIGIAVADLAGAILEANDAYLDMLGYTREDLRSGTLRWNEMTPPEYRAVDQAASEALRRTGVSPPWEKEILRKDGTRVPVLLGVAMLEASEASFIAYIVDLSKSRQLEKQFRQAQKMEAVGQLAGGVAHDFNNLLTAILGYTELATARVADDPGASEELEEIRKAGERAAALTRQLLAFSRRQVLEPRVLDLNAIVGDLEKMLRRLIGEDIDLVTTLDPSLGRVRADAGEIEQVIMNLAVNSRDAMPEGGKMTIETANVELNEAYAREHASVHPGRYVMLAVSDTGIGMDSETQSHIFEPFFTTKAKDKGTGLGLSTVYGIVRQSGGWVSVYSEPGSGTTLKIYLPEVDEVAEAVPPRVEASLAGGSETVLLAEDEEPVRKLARRVLESLGYCVLEAARGKDALSIASSHEGPIHLIVTDVVMPEMGGADLVTRVQELRPEARVLYMSGYTDDAIIRHKVLERGTHFLQKPFTPASLARKVREALS